MKITFGILIDDNYITQRVQNIVYSIERQNSITENDYEIFIGGNYRNDIISNKPLKIIDLGDDYKSGWLTKKRNIIAQKSQYENCCIMNSYYVLKQGWYEGLLKYNIECSDWDVLRVKIIKDDNTRYYDWCLDQSLVKYFFHKHPNLNGINDFNIDYSYCELLPYEIDNLTHLQVICGGFILAKTKKILEVPFIEKMIGWEKINNRLEDEWWTIKLLCNSYKLKMNTYSTVSLQKYKNLIYDFPIDLLETFISFYDKQKLLEIYKEKLKKYDL